MQHPSIVIFLLVFINSFYGAAKQFSKRTVEIVRSHGFDCEMYVLRALGYPLTLYHITNPLANQETLNKYPVLYGHGIFYDSASMLSRSENAKPRKPVLGEPTVKYGNSTDSSDDYSLPLMFSNNNFDVWMFDARGTNQDNRDASITVVFSEGAHRFWDFSLDDQALKDIPLIIDFVLAKTASEKLIYVGYSETTFFIFALLSTAPGYSDKLTACIALAPVCYLTSIRGLSVPLLAPAVTIMPDFFHTSTIPQVFIDLADSILRNLCAVRSLSDSVCRAFANSIGGRGDGENLPDFFSQFYKSTSLKSIKQFIQLFISKQFRMYDYGPTENRKRYGTATAPAYDLAKVKLDRIILARGSSDFLSTLEDQDLLLQNLGAKPYLDIIIPHYNHFDFIDGKDLIKLVNEPVMRAVYELLYKDGPNIYMNKEQVALVTGKASPPIGNLTNSGTASWSRTEERFLFKILFDKISVITNGILQQLVNF